MRRLLVMMTGVAAALLAVGCNKNAETVDNPPPSTGAYDTTGGGAYTTTSGGGYSTTGGGGYASTGNPYSGGSTYTNTTASDPYAANPGNYSSPSTTTTSGGAGGGGQTYTVQRGDTLYKLARQFYGDQARWRDIYNANSGQINNPNQLSAGMQLIIP